MLSNRVTILRRVVRTVSIGSRCRCRYLGGRAFPLRECLNYRVGRHQLTTLAIETSCDDTSVAVLDIKGYEDKREWEYISEILFHERVTANSAQYGGIHPIVALDSHQRNLGSLVKRAIESIPQDDSPPDLIAVTRGPGLSRANLSVGLDMAKGLALAWDVPLVGVHHMQAHALTPRLCSILRASNDESEQIIQPGDRATGTWTLADVEPNFPFLTVLASGGHSTLLASNSLTDHRILAETSDIAIGDCLDKAARAILPEWALGPPYGKALEDFAFDGATDYEYTPPARRHDELERRVTRWGWSIGPPLADSKGAEKSSRRMMYSFAGVLNTIERLMEGASGASRSIDERRELARETMRVVFEHLTSRILLYLQDLPPGHRDKYNTIVLSGGVAANGFLRHVLRSTLDVRGFDHIALETPPVELCTDNALMVAWAGVEMYDAGYESDIGIQPIKKWSMDPGAEDGGILGPSGWVKKERAKDDPPRRFWHSLFILCEQFSAQLWRKSFNETIGRLQYRIYSYPAMLLPVFALSLRSILGLVDARAKHTGGALYGHLDDLDLYYANNEHVRKVVPKDRLLIFEAKGGFKPLGEFLGVPVPRDEHGTELAYPHANDRDEITKIINGFIVFCWMLGSVTFFRFFFAMSRGWVQLRRWLKS